MDRRSSRRRRPSHFPAYVDTVEVNTANGDQEQVVAGDERSLVYLAGQACITPHTWLSTTEDLDRPDQLVFDLDPSVAGPRAGAARHPARRRSAR